MGTCLLSFMHCFKERFKLDLKCHYFTFNLPLFFTSFDLTWEAVRAAKQQIQFQNNKMVA